METYLDPDSVNLVIYHDKCPDGFGSAYAAWKRLGDRATYIGCDHGSSSYPSVTGKRVVVLDFSFKFHILKRMIGEADRLMVIDHHSSAEEELKNIPEHHKMFDMSRSGATMSWNFFHPSIMVPSFLLYIEDRDLWKWKLNYSREICAGLDTYPQTFEQWDQLSSVAAIKQLQTRGTSIIQYRQSLVESISSKSAQKEYDGFVCRVVNVCGGSLFSDVGDYLLSKYNVPVALMWYFDYPSKQYKISLRSRPDVDCSVIATRHGGGGHKQACAFTISQRNKQALDDFLRSVVYE